MELKKYLYDEIIDKIKETLEWVENCWFKDNNYQLFLANGDVIKYGINKNNIAHLMGIDTNKLASYKIMEKEDSYEMLKKLVENPFKYWTSMKEKQIVINEIFSPYVKNKLDNFRLQYQIPYPNQIYFVCKYDRQRNYSSKQIDGLYAEYYIARKNEQGDIVLLGLVKMNDEGNYYAPQTSRIIVNDDSFEEKMSELLNNQIITYLNGLNISNEKSYYNNTINLNTLEILDKLQNIKDICYVTNGISSTLADHIYNLKTLSKNKHATFDSKGVLIKVRSMIKNGEVISLDDEESKMLDATIMDLIDKYNDFMFSDNNISSNEQEIYSKIKQERNDLINENSGLLSKLNEAKQKYIELQEQLKQKDEEISELNKTKNDYIELDDKVKKFINSLK